jgi:hypothetical protein
MNIMYFSERTHRFMKLHLSMEIDNLRIYCLTAYFLGWILIVVSILNAVWYGPSYSRQFTNNYSAMFAMISIFGSFANMLILGLSVLVAASFLQFLGDHRHKPGLFLSSAPKLLYFCAVIILCHALASLWVQYHRMLPSDALLGLAFVTLTAGSKILIMAGLARGLRRLLPMIEESKSLV